MKIAIMQPYFLPYIGYFQLMSAVDEFVVYDNIEFTKKGWINRNRLLVNGADDYFTLPLKKDSDFLHVKDRYLADTWAQDSVKMLNRMKESYRKAPHFDEAYSLAERCILHNDPNLFGFILHSLECVKQHLAISTPLVVSSSIPADHNLKAEKKVMAICNAQKATTYINPQGGVELYNKDEFTANGITLLFIKTSEIVYPQLGQPFVPFLSILDVLMFNPKEKVKEYLNSYYTLA